MAESTIAHGSVVFTSSWERDEVAMILKELLGYSVTFVSY